MHCSHVATINSVVYYVIQIENKPPRWHEYNALTDIAQQPAGHLQQVLTLISDPLFLEQLEGGQQVAENVSVRRKKKQKHTIKSWMSGREIDAIIIFSCLLLKSEPGWPMSRG